jgi:hypothetical protein
MNYSVINKIDLFLRRHLLMASFICLTILIHVLTLPIHIEYFLDQVKESFFNVVTSYFFLTILNAIPVFLFSFLLYLSTRFEYSSEPNLTLRQTFSISLFSNSILISFMYFLFFLFLGRGEIGVTLIRYLIFIILTACVYSLIFSAFFSWFGNVPNSILVFKYKFIFSKFDSVVMIILLNCLVNTLMCLFSFAHIILHFRM